MAEEITVAQMASDIVDTMFENAKDKLRESCREEGVPEAEIEVYVEQICVHIVACTAKKLLNVSKVTFG